MKKNDRVKMGNKVGTVVGSVYRLVSDNERYVEVLFDGDQYMETVQVKIMELI